MKTRRGFTLVEMLTVIVIIGILAGMTMKLMVYVAQKNGKSRASGDIERIKHALVEYHAIYGIFPPCSSIAWEYENDLYKPAAPPDSGMGLYDGLATYLYSDPQNGRWMHFVEGLQSTDLIAHKGNKASFGDLTWSNNFCTIRDPWERDYVYATSDPYQSFKLYSKGPDGIANTVDDIGTKFNE
jgi:prepilin-type N-terminal cleavage/methylation domain-containing protein